MKRSTFGVLVAGAVLALGSSLALAAEDNMKMGSDAKACYRKECGKSIKGHEGKCGGTKVDGVATQAACDTAGGAWTTEADAAQYEKKS